MNFNLISMAFSANADKGFLRTVQKTAGTTAYSAILNIVTWVVLIAVTLGEIIYLLNRYLLNPNTPELPMERFEIRDTDKIHSILDEADARKSVMVLRTPEYRYEPYKRSLLDYRRNEHNRFKRAKIFLMGVRFTRRGIIREEKLFFERLQALTNDDLHKWVTALYARQLRREKGLKQKRFEYLET